MRYRKLLLFLFLSFISANAFAAVFVVTSNADSGPGTLREALTLAAANGSVEKDYINFNLPGSSEADVTITLKTQLPNISSNLVIDGTTQPGNAFGASNAKIILQSITANPGFDAFVLLDVDGFELYGLYVRDFNNPIYYLLGQGVPNFTAALYVETSKNIQIGAPGKGNVFSNITYYIETAIASLKNNAVVPLSGIENLKVCANFFGFEPDGKSFRGSPLSLAGGIDLTACKGTIEIGGADPTKKNIFGNGYSFISQDSNFNSNVYTSSILIKNNYFGYDVHGQPVAFPISNASSFIAISLAGGPAGANIPPYTVNIINNKIQYPLQAGVSDVQGEVNFQGNIMLREPSLYLPFGASVGVGLGSETKVTMGGSQLGEGNKIYGVQARLYSPKSVILSHNSIYCVNVSDGEGAWYYAGNNSILPNISIIGINNSVVSGTATPLSTIEIFDDDDCETCDPLTYIGSTIADASGNWSYNGTITKGIIASATINGFTSLFTSFANVKSFTLTHSSCGKNNGSVTDIVSINSGGYEIFNTDTHLKVGNTGLGPGNYTITSPNGTCSTNHDFKVYDATPVIDASVVKIVQPGCGEKNGSITNLQLAGYANQVFSTDYGAYKYKWLDDANFVKGTYMDISDLGPGNYRLEVTYKDQCAAIYGPVILKNTTGPNINQSALKIQATGCSNSTGYITGITATGSGTLKYSWLNSSQQQVSTDPDLINQPPGMYYLQVSDGSACPPVAIPGITIPGLNDVKIDESNVKKGYSDCTQSLGYISGIKVTGSGTLTYAWVNINGVSLGSTVDITGLPINKYRLMVSNGSCSPVYSAYYEIDQSGATYLTTAVKLIPPTCSSPGSITGITESNATSNIWKDANGVIVGHDLDLLNIPAGDYTLTIINLCGIAITTQPFHLPSPDQNYPAYASTIKNSCYQQNNGSVTLNADAQPKAFRWVNSAGQTISDQQNLTGVAGGTYQLYLTSQAGCETLYQTYNITESTAIGINGQGLVTNEQCGLKNGGVSGIAVTGGLQPYVYQWTNDAGNPVGSDISIKNLSAGNYKLNITDAGCSNVNLPFTITNETQMLPTPSVSDIQLCSSGTALVTVNNPLDQVSYRLYNTQTGMQPLDEQKSGRFTVTITADRSYFISEVTGTCESIKAQLNVKVGLTDLHIANTFTPNSDGINDYWAISGLQKYPNSVTQVYTRNGQKVFESKGYAVPFDGTFNGKKLPVGVYYYIINLSANCSVLSGSLTIIR